ncbi:MAG: glutamine amidotransferase [Actinomycetales bacterium]
MRPFLLLATRAEDAPADSEYAAMLRYGGLQGEELVRHRLEAVPLPADLDLDRYSGVILGGSPFNNSDPQTTKSAVQLRVESDMARLLDVVIARDFPLLGACYGVGSVGTHQGGTVDRRYGEPVSAVTITLTDAGRQDALFAEAPASFRAFVGHKEAISVLPPSAVRLAGSAACPVQAFRVGRNVYATQYHPELDAEGLATRVDAYAHHGYFHPSEAAALKAMAAAADVEYAQVILRAFCRRYARD